MRHILTILLIALLTYISMSAQTPQTVVNGSVADKDGAALAGSTVLFLQSDTIAGGTVTDRKGKFELKGLQAGEYECRVSMIGFKPESQKFSLTGKAKLPQFVLEEDATALDEVTVSAGMRSKELAGMSIYYLSDRAKKESNAYYALQEIPRLVINPIERKIRLDNGSSPLILVNGVRKPLDVISPEMIESVEVIDNPSARYRGEVSVTSVLNIKLKKDGIKPYVRGNIGANLTPNANFITSNASIEFGTVTSSIYANGSYNQTRKSQSKQFSDIYQGNLHKLVNALNEGNWRRPSIRIGGDKELSKKDYLALSVMFIAQPSKNKTVMDGNVIDISNAETSILQSESWSRIRDHSLAGNLYYKHDFNKNRIIEISGDYYYSLDGNKAYREENCALYSYSSAIDLDNSRHMGKIDVNFSEMLSKSIHLEVGSNTEYSVTNIDDLLDALPTFRYQRTREYIYAGIDNNRSSTARFNYVVSLGLDMVFSDAAGEKHNYIDFVPSVSLRYKFDSKNNISLIYDRTRTMPSAGQLNPFNTSTDILYVNVGNPLLKPSRDDKIKFEYVFNNRGFRINPYVQYSYQSNIILPHQYLVDDIYVSTYQNLGHTAKLLGGTSFSYNFPYNRLYYGYIGIDIFYVKDYIKDMSFNSGSLGSRLMANFGIRNISVSGFFGLWDPFVIYSRYTKTKLPIASQLIFSWKANKSWSFTMMLSQFLWQKMHTKTWTVNDDYVSYSTSVPTRLTPQFSIGVWYTFATKNFKWRNKKQFYGSDDELKSISTQ